VFVSGPGRNPACAWAMNRGTATAQFMRDSVKPLKPQLVSVIQKAYFIDKKFALYFRTPWLHPRVGLSTVLLTAMSALGGLSLPQGEKIWRKTIPHRRCNLLWA